jgi:heme A synthase
MTTDPATPVRTVSRWLHAWAILAAAATLGLLILGQLVTSFRAGMADPIWPTEPWYLFSNYKLDFGYLVEHTHRIAGFTVGGLVAVLAFGLWWTEPRRASRWIALAGLVVLLAGFGEFHRGLMAQRDVSAHDVRVPMNSVGVTLGGLVIVLAIACSGLMTGVRGAGIRLLGTFALLAVMIQGLLGGFRVKLNVLVGTDLAAVHGVFAQVVFCLLVTVAVVTAPSPASNPGADPRERSLRRWSVGLALLLFIQVVWGALVRHDTTPLNQRLHYITAFAALAAAVLVSRALFAIPAARNRAGAFGWVLGILLAAQLYLGVEAWMAKFGTYTLPELVPITPEGAAIRTAHALIGSGLLATAVALAVRLRISGGTDQPASEVRQSTWTERPTPVLQNADIALQIRGNAT